MSIEENFDVRDLYVEVGHYVLPRLAQYRDEASSGYSFPLDISSHEEWIEILDKMIYAFVSVTHDNDNDDHARVMDGLILFGRYFKELYL